MRPLLAVFFDGLADFVERAQLVALYCEDATYLDSCAHIMFIDLLPRDIWVNKKIANYYISHAEVLSKHLVIL